LELARTQSRDVVLPIATDRQLRLRCGMWKAGCLGHDRRPFAVILAADIVGYSRLMASRRDPIIVKGYIRRRLFL
jgi:hypothetical protein